MKITTNTKYLVLVIATIIIYPLLSDSHWIGSTNLHTSMEAIATLLALVTGVFALIRYYSLKSNLYLIVGVAFLGTAILDGYHAVISSVFVYEYIPSDLISLSPWSWLASRFFLSVVLFFGWFHWKINQENEKPIDERTVYLVSILFTLGCFYLFAFIELPQAYFDNLFFHRPEEFVPGIFFLATLIGFYLKGEWRKNDFEIWLIYSLIINTLAQFLFMSRSTVLFDIEFDVAHSLKKVSYVIVLIGLFRSSYHSFKQLNEEVIRRKQIEIENQEHIIELIEERKKADQANKAKSEFLANMSHEIRTPMNAVLGFSDIIYKTTKEEKIKRYTSTILQSGKSLLAIINDVLDLSSIETGKLNINSRQTNLTSLINELSALFNHRAEEKDISLKMNLPYDLPDIIIDDLRLKQILFNLIGNSIKFTPQGSINLDVVLLSQNEKNTLVIKIRDTGIGIAEGKLSEIFESFTQENTSINREYGGTGLGLTISNKLVTAMGGELNVQSKKGYGSEFKITFPDIEITSSKIIYDSLKFQEVGKNLSFKNQTILVVDDVEYNIDLVQSYLSDTNLNIITASNGAEAITVAKENNPDLILMDLKMPVLNGYEATKAINNIKQAASIPTIAITASIMSLGEKLDKSIFKEIIYKPVQQNELLYKLSSYLDHDYEKDIKNGFTKNVNDSFNELISNFKNDKYYSDIKDRFKERFETAIENGELSKIIGLSNDFAKFEMDNKEVLQHISKYLKEKADLFEFEELKKIISKIF